MTNLEAAREVMRRLGYSTEQIKEREEYALKQMPTDFAHRKIAAGKEEETINRQMAEMQMLLSMEREDVVKRRDVLMQIVKEQIQKN